MVDGELSKVVLLASEVKRLSSFIVSDEVKACVESFSLSVARFLESMDVSSVVIVELDSSAAAVNEYMTRDD